MLVVVGTGTAWKSYHDVVKGVTTSKALDDGPKSVGTDQNILIMGLDSRLDQRGKPLPQKMYNALHAGDDSVGGYNSNVLIMVHIPGDGSKATGISIPRDDYVPLAKSACGSAVTCKGKIKQAYGRAFDIAKTKLQNSGVTDGVELEQRSREAGRKAEISTVRSFLGNIAIDHFVEVTLVSFFQIAQVVQPITVCLNEKTSDSFSGAKFRKGMQPINAAQAMAFVRQRRDPDESLNFTDLDRTRRQQAFILSLARKLQDGGTFSNPTAVRGLLDVAKQNIAVDAGLDLMSFAKQASKLASGGLSMFTLPVVDFKKNEDGEEVNVVDTDAIRATVHKILNPPPPTPKPAPGSAPAPKSDPSIAAAKGIVADVVNGTSRTGLASHVEKELIARGFTQGQATTAATPRSATTLAYGNGAAAAATALASQLGVTATKSGYLDAGSIRLTIGTDATPNSIIPDPSTDLSAETSTTTAKPLAPVEATAVGSKAPAPTDLSSMTSTTGIPCVK